MDELLIQKMVKHNERPGDILIKERMDARIKLDRKRDSDTRSAKDLRSSKLQNEMDEYLKCHPNVASKWNWLGNVDDIFKYYKDADALIAVA